MSSSPKTELKLDWCSYQAVKWACEHWHYSGTVPAGKLLKIGVWEAGAFIGCVIFSRGGNNRIGSPYGLRQTECCELTRVALKQHSAPVTRMVASAIRMLRRQCPGLRLLVSYADPMQDHAGVIYQAGNWLYEGKTKPQKECIGPDGRIVHKRSVFSAKGSVSGVQ